MKRVTFYLLGLAVIAFTAAPLSADILYSDNFDSYTDGDLAGQGGWAAHSGAGNEPIPKNGQTILVGGRFIDGSNVAVLRHRQ